MNESKGAVREFLLTVAAGLLAYNVLVDAVYLFIGKFTLGAALGALYGSGVMLLYYFIFAKATVSAAENNSDAETAKKRIQAAYSLRMFMLVLLMGVGVFFSSSYAPIKVFEWLPLIISMIVPRIAIAGWQIVQKIKGGSGKNEEGEG